MLPPLYGDLVEPVEPDYGDVSFLGVEGVGGDFCVPRRGFVDVGVVAACAPVADGLKERERSDGDEAATERTDPEEPPERQMELRAGRFGRRRFRGFLLNAGEELVIEEVGVGELRRFPSGAEEGAEFLRFFALLGGCGKGFGKACRFLLGKATINPSG